MNSHSAVANCIKPTLINLPFIGKTEWIHVDKCSYNFHNAHNLQLKQLLLINWSWVAQMTNPLDICHHCVDTSLILSTMLFSTFLFICPFVTSRLKHHPFIKGFLNLCLSANSWHIKIKHIKMLKGNKDIVLFSWSQWWFSKQFYWLS